MFWRDDYDRVRDICRKPDHLIDVRANIMGLALSPDHRWVLELVIFLWFFWFNDFLSMILILSTLIGECWSWWLQIINCYVIVSEISVYFGTPRNIVWCNQTKSLEKFVIYRVVQKKGFTPIFLIKRKCISKINLS